MVHQADILNSFDLTTTQLKSYHTVKTRFDKHFVVRQISMTGIGILSQY